MVDKKETARVKWCQRVDWMEQPMVQRTDHLRALETEPVSENPPEDLDWAVG